MNIVAAIVELTLVQALVTAVIAEAGVIALLFKALDRQWKARVKDAETYLRAHDAQRAKSSNPPGYSTPPRTNRTPGLRRL